MWTQTRHFPFPSSSAEIASSKSRAVAGSIVKVGRSRRSRRAASCSTVCTACSAARTTPGGSDGPGRGGAGRPRGRLAPHPGRPSVRRTFGRALPCPCNRTSVPGRSPGARCTTSWRLWPIRRSAPSSRKGGKNCSATMNLPRDCKRPTCSGPPLRLGALTVLARTAPEPRARRVRAEEPRHAASRRRHAHGRRASGPHRGRCRRRRGCDPWA